MLQANINHVKVGTIADDPAVEVGTDEWNDTLKLTASGSPAAGNPVVYDPGQPRNLALANACKITDAGIEHTGTGPYGLGAASVPQSQLHLAGTYSSTSASVGGKFHFTGTFNSFAAQSASLVLVNGILAEASSGIHTDLSCMALQGTFSNAAATATRVSMLRIAGFAAPAGTDRAQNVYIAALPTGATNNYGIYTRGRLYFQASGTDTDPSSTIATANGTAAIHLTRNNTDGATALVTLVQTGDANAHGTEIAFFKTRSGGDAGANTVVQSGDVIMRLRGWGSSSSAYHEAARIEMAVDGAAGTNDMPGRIVFYTTADGGTTLSEVLRLGQDKKATFAGGLDVAGGLSLVAGTAPVDDAVLMTEITDPSAPAANQGVLYVRDNGAGKTQLVVRFPTGAVQVVATEP